MSTIETRASQWLLGNDTGVSSKALCAHMLHGTPPRKYDYPSDGGDLGRCLRLLEIIPEWKSRVPEMTNYGPYWSALVKQWDALTASLSEETGTTFDSRKFSPKTYKLMKMILNPIEGKDANVMRLGKGVTMRFGE